MRIANNYQNGDGHFKHRLQSFFYEHFQTRIRSIHQIKPLVYKVLSCQGPFILKGFSSIQSFNKQKALTNYLKENQFQETYSILTNQDLLIPFENRYFAALEYLPPHQTPFTYRTIEEIKEGLSLLEKFHQTTKTLKENSLLYPFYNQQKRWEKRLKEFLSYEKSLLTTLDITILQSFIFWAKWALEGMNRNPSIHLDTAIVHGDVAHHNFFRHKNGKLYLIDFDLASKSPIITDYLQLAIRILPYIHWDVQQMFSLWPLERYKEDRWFLFGLMFPSDVLREWNHFLRNASGWKQGISLQTLLQKTNHDFLGRQKLFNDLKKMI